MIKCFTLMCSPYWIDTAFTLLQYFQDICNTIDTFLEHRPQVPLKMILNFEVWKLEICPKPRPLLDSNRYHTIIRTHAVNVYIKIFNGCGTIENITAQNQKGEVVIRYA